MEFGPIFRSLLRNRARVILIVAEVALTLAIVANCLGLILDTRAKLARPSGFDDEHLIAIYSNPFDDRLRDPKLLNQLADQDRRALAAVAGVRAISETSLRPWESSGSRTSVRVPGTHNEPVPTQNAQAEPMLLTSQAKFCPKKPVRKVSGRKIVAMIASCFITTLSRLDTVDR